MTCDLCGGSRQCTSIGVCSPCVLVLRTGAGAAARVAELEAALVAAQRDAASWRRMANEEKARADDLEQKNEALEESAAELIAAVEGAT